MGMRSCRHDCGHRRRTDVDRYGGRPWSI